LEAGPIFIYQSLVVHDGNVIHSFMNITKFFGVTDLGSQVDIVWRRTFKVIRSVHNWFPGSGRLTTILSAQIFNTVL